jgi:hypothetical protein
VSNSTIHSNQRHWAGYQNIVDCLLGPAPTDYCIGSNFWKFYLIRIGFTLGELVSLVKVFRLFILEWIFLVFRVDRCTTSYLMAGLACLCLRKEHAKSCLVYTEGNKIRDITWELTSNGVLSCHIKDIISDTKVVSKLSAFVLECPCLLCWANFRALL